MSGLPQPLYRAAQVRELDRLAIEKCGIPGATLMENAGHVAFDELCRRWPRARDLAVVCGAGNNAGDGYVVARLAHEAGRNVSVFQIGDGKRLRGDALAAFDALRRAGIKPAGLTAGVLEQADVIVDALLGTGLDRAVDGVWLEAIDAINGSRRPVLAVDIPSGLNADTGAAMDVAVCAQATVTFIGLKQGLFTGQGPACCGAIVFNDLQVPQEVYGHVNHEACRFDRRLVSRWLPPRSRIAHKGNYGHVLIVGGDHGMAGALRMAGEAAARTGAGLVTLATRVAHAGNIAQARPELMCHGVETVSQLRQLMERASVVAIGPGLGRSEWAQQLLATVIDSSLPLVVDADALNGLAAEPATRGNWVLTPHPGEAGRLLHASAADVQSDRFAAVRSLQQRYAGVVVLKGAGSLICSGSGPLIVCEAGNPGMASGGMGDLLTGIIAGLIAQHVELPMAAALGTWLHAAAADAAAAAGERGLLATDLLPYLRQQVNPIDP